MVHVPLIFVRMAWISFGALPCRKKELDDSSRLDVLELKGVAWQASFQPLLQENTRNSAHKQTHLSNDTIDSVLWCREVGRAYDLSAPPRRIPVNYLVRVIYGPTTYTLLYVFKWMQLVRHFAQLVPTFDSPGFAFPLNIKHRFLLAIDSLILESPQIRIQFEAHACRQVFFYRFVQMT